MAMPMGMPTEIDRIVATVIMDSVRMVLSHMPKYPISKNATNTPPACL